jgi:hypothetical protein
VNTEARIVTVVDEVKPSITEQANEMFLERVRQISGARVEVGGGDALVEQTFRVFVKSRESDAWRQVRELEGEVLDRFPRARLDVWLSEERPSA